jgi:predicted Fe-Mo cluster-binding NifX family protein
MKIAVTSQSRKKLTEHAGRCRKLWVFTTDGESIVSKELLELPKSLYLKGSLDITA